MSRRRIKVAHPNLFAFLGHLQRTTTDNQADVDRLNRGMAIRRAKKRVNIMNDRRIKLCMGRFDSNSYTRLQFLRAVSHYMGAHSSRLCDEATESEHEDNSDDDTETDGDRDSAAVATQNAAVVVNEDCCEVCLVAPRDARIALVPGGHQRFCASCATEVHRQRRGCPICRGVIDMILHLF